MHWRGLRSSSRSRSACCWPAPEARKYEGTCASVPSPTATLTFSVGESCESPKMRVDSWLLGQRWRSRSVWLLSRYFFREPCVVWLTRSLVGPGATPVDRRSHWGSTDSCLRAWSGRPTSLRVRTEPGVAALIDLSIHLNGFGGFVRVMPSALDSSSGEVKRLFLSVDTMNSGDVVAAESRDVRFRGLRGRRGQVAFDDFARRVQLSGASSVS